MRASVIVPSVDAQNTRKLLEAQGLWDRSRRLQKQGDGRVAIPINTADSSCLATLLSNDVCIAETDLPPSKKELLLAPAHRLKLAMQDMLQENGVEPATRETLMEEVPSHWERHGDLILLPASAFLSPTWATLGKDLWRTVAHFLGSERVARQSVVMPNGFRSPQVVLLLGDGGVVQHVDNGIKYQYDVTKCMFSAGNISEKLRIASFSCQGETIVDLYAGIGYFTLPYLVHAGAEHVHACEWNLDAAAALAQNLILNKVASRCTIHPGDNRQLSLCGVADRVNLGLIPSSQSGWPVACRVLKAEGGILHVHGNVNSNTGVGEELQTDDDTKYNEHNKDCPEGSLVSSSFQEQVEGEENSWCGKPDYLDNPCSSCTTPCCTFPGYRTGDGVDTCGEEAASELPGQVRSWERWGLLVCSTLRSLVEKEHGGQWTAVVRHIECVKSYAPHIHHVVLDIECRPLTCTA